MVTFIPPYLGEEIKSNAERKMFEILQDLSLKNVYVLHSLGLPRHRRKIYGEIDFVVVCERGIACLEIKGGRVECRDGAWIFTDRYGVEHEKREGPFAQVSGNMFSLRDVLKEHFSGNPHMKNLLIACGVVFPDITFRAVGEEMIPEIVYDASTQDINTYMNQIFDYWQERGRWETSKLSPSDIREIVEYLRGDFCFVPTLGDRLDAVEKHLVRLTKEQAQVMDALAVNEHLLIEGNAGTGKTLLAADFARKQAETGRKVLFLTYNKNLANHVNRQLFGGYSGDLRIINIHAFFTEYVPVDEEKMREDFQKYFSEILPEAFFDYLNGLTKEERDALQYDLIVMDEGQDLLRPVYLYSLDMLLKGGLEKGNWAIFYDEKQNIYNPEYQEGMELVASYSCARFKLFVNCRNTVQIGTYSFQMSGLELGDFIRENGEEVQKIAYGSPADFKGKVKDIMAGLREEKVRMQDVTFLSPKRYEHSMLKETSIRINELKDGFDESIQIPVFATIQGFKGLDAKVVILLDVDDIREEYFSRYLYIAGTRARTLLYVVGSEEFWKRHSS